ncbi:phosphoinositide phospholipase C 2-like [Prosopis cineraria]|uniref:phosphoinositide phospholipase C 2-like n=1 Tax=Prosopis cineraria TaxID=364024 RepID=UPI00241040F1|nr:phosphoinositide phospholipase C 2-like [Prosopis cineraria]
MASSSGERETTMKTRELKFRVCFCFRRRFKVKAGEAPEDVRKAFNKYSTNGTMSVDELLKFLVCDQGEREATREEAQRIYDSVKHLSFLHRRGLHLDAFFRYLLGEGDHNGPLRRVEQDMNAPLAHYFIFTGHNSYLTGNQISSDSSTEPIIDALKNGVKVIELDLWPNSRGDGAEVRHGGTLTAPVELRDCLEAIKEHAFEASDYPVIITFEDHLNSRLQAKVAQMVRGIFGQMLYCPDSRNTEQTQFPSPESLKGKIMISTKPPEHPDRRGIDELEFDEDVTEYRNLIAIHAGKPKGSVEHWLLTGQSRVRRVSLSEQELEDIANTYGKDLVRFTQNNLLRIYPKGTRLDSSNYNPMIGWSHGAQMVAFNMQGHGKYLWIMEGMFRAYGSCGYVKKPDILLEDPDDVFYPFQADDPIKQHLLVTVYMGDGWRSDFGGTHFDFYSPPDFFVKVGISGVAGDSTEMKKTKAVEDQWVPVWNERFKFQLRVPELAILRVEVMEFDTSGKHDFGGQTCLPVSLIKTGIRAVPLYNRKGQLYPSVRLLMGFEFVDSDSAGFYY